MTELQSFKCEVGGRDLVIETGKLAQQAGGAVTLRYGDTVVLVTVCVAPKPREGVDFLPLTIDYEERMYAAGKIPGGFIRREGRPSQEAILAARQTDRPLRPLLPKTWRRDIQLIITILSADQENDPDVLATIGSSAVLSISEVPFAGPISAVHVGFIDGQMILNPTMAQLDDSLVDLVISSTKDAVIMIEAGAKEASEDIMLEAIKFGHEANQNIILLQEQLQQACGKPKVDFQPAEVNEELIAAVAAATSGRLTEALSNKDKAQREQALSDLKAELMTSLGETFPEADIINAFEAELKASMRANVLEKGQRISGRGLTEVRTITCEVGLLPRTHGSALFSRGQTQVLNITTLGPIKKEQMLDGLGIEESKRFMHHYNFPPFSAGEVRRVGSPGRREIGHGALAERALLPVLPKDEDCPYTIRLVSECLSSSGSTSMASVCSSSLSLMDAGIPIKNAVAGLAMGLITDDKDNSVILTDIEGIEDFTGDMDFKVAGTTEGITAIQMDTKIKGISLDIVAETLSRARDGRVFILDKMNQTISSSRLEVSRYAPRMHKMTIDPDKIGAVIGSGGKTIRSIVEQTKATIDIDNDGTVLIGALDDESTQKAIKMIEGLVRDVEVGVVYTGKVMRIMNFGAFVEILPGKEGLVHISELADHRVEKVEDEVRVGDEITVQVTEVDNMGRVNLSRRAVYGDSSSDSGAGIDKDYPFKKRRESGGSSRQSRPSQNRPRY
ncbi:polyribonucleotide nucleotidyltransferase [Chloroflexota bacterium]